MGETQTNADPLLECDLVMKGGIASGIVYPSAVLQLKDKYRFRNIGGTSAGAIAAAAVAAAEYGRDAGGYAKLQALNDKLCEDHFLRSLIQPAPNLRLLVELASAVFRASDTPSKPKRVLAKTFGVTGALLRFAWPPLAIGGALGAALFYLFTLLVHGTAQQVSSLIPLLLFGGFGALTAVGVVVIHKLLNDIPANFFGICIGHAAPSTTPNPPPIIDWLITQIEGMAGTNDPTAPLTFGDLESKGILLKMMTTNVSQEFPYTLPFERNDFLFTKEDMERLFPPHIVKHLIAKARKSERVTPPPGFYVLPIANDMPIVVCMRMSLSFPVLFSAVPLYTLNASAYPKLKAGATLTADDLDRNWFSDGGECSNFPIHFFDRWLPTRPTFGINLTAVRQEDTQDANSAQVKTQVYTGLNEQSAQDLQEENLTEAVHLSRPNEVRPRVWNDIQNLPRFLGGIVSTMQNYRDNLQAELPSYRERIVEIRLAKNEGGMNIDMPVETLRQVADKGRQAGVKLQTAFSMDHHAWTRYLVLMGELEANLQEMEQVLAEPVQLYESLPAQQLQAQSLSKSDPGRFAYPRSPAWCNETQKRIKSLRLLLQSDWKTIHFNADPPRPDANLHIGPRQ